jgi:ATP-dependent helicase/nuclease subunit A
MAAAEEYDTYKGCFTEGDGAAVNRASRLLALWNTQKDMMSVPEFLDSLLQDIHYWAVVSRGSRGKQTAANGEKLMEQVRSLYIRENIDFYSFTEWLNNRVNYIENEGEAGLDPSQGEVVQIMTVHASKGLEFPMVFVPDLSAGFNLGEKEDFIADEIPISINTDAHAIDRETLFDFSISAPDPEDGFKKKPGIIKKIIQYWRKKKLIAEKKRLLYVAVTRTMNHLILVGQIKSDNERHKKHIRDAPINRLANWRDWICKILHVYKNVEGRSGTLPLSDDNNDDTFYIPYIRYVSAMGADSFYEEYRTEF